MQLASAAKYPLLLKMVLRLYQAAGVLPPGQQPQASITFGSYLPTDQARLLALVVKGVTVRVLSLETGVRMLVDAGFPIEDAAEEVARIWELRKAELGAGESVHEMESAMASSRSSVGIAARGADEGGAVMVGLRPARGRLGEESAHDVAERCKRQWQARS
ncbi:hypothetical protein AB0H29_04445 [Streptomyces thermolilacinus]